MEIYVCFHLSVTSQGIRARGDKHDVLCTTSNDGGEDSSRLALFLPGTPEKVDANSGLQRRAGQPIGRESEI